jgi:hypothetical protein
MYGSPRLKQIANFSEQRSFFPLSPNDRDSGANAALPNRNRLALVTRSVAPFLHEATKYDL